MSRHNGNIMAMVETKKTRNAILLTFIIIYGNKINDNILVVFFSNKVKTKVQKGNRFWTFINVHFWKTEKTFK